MGSKASDLPLADTPERVFVVVPFRHNPNRDDDVTRRCVRAWLATPGVDQLVFVDASQSPLSLDHDPRLRTLHAPFEGLFNLAFLRNVGVRHALDSGAGFIQVMDADIFPQGQGFIERCLANIVRVDMLKPRVRNSSRSAPDFQTPEDPIYQRFVHHSLSQTGRDHYSYSTMFMRACVPRHLHGWDEEYQGWGAEDDDFLFRATQLGYRSSLQEESLLVHSHHEPDLERYSKDESRQYEHNVARLRRTERGGLPLIRMPDDWGLSRTPRYWSQAAP